MNKPKTVAKPKPVSKLNTSAPKSKRFFPNRYDKTYLKFLIKSLNVKQLEKTALEIKNDKKETIYKLIEIDYCGFSASNLLGTNLEKKNEGQYTLDLRTKTAEAFKALFSKSTLKKLKTKGTVGSKTTAPEKKLVPVFLKVRFLFSYLRADFPACIIKAEQPEVWENIAGPYDFYISRPLTLGQFEGSQVFKSQQASLESIIQIYNGAKELIDTDVTKKERHSMQVRFTGIPSPVCYLRINNLCFTDTYLYSKLEPKEPLLTSHYPVLSFNKGERQDKKAFLNLERHFQYLWKYDLTMYCKDVTDYKEFDIKGLAKVRSPGEIVWDQKIERIVDAKTEYNRKNGLPAYNRQDDEEKIKLWQENLYTKLGMSTTKIIKSQAATENGQEKKFPEARLLGLEIGVNEKSKVFFRIKHMVSGESLLYIEPARKNLTFCMLIQYGYNKINPAYRPTVLTNSTYLSTPNKFKKQIKEWLSKANEEMQEQRFNMLFSDDENGVFKLNIERINVNIDLTKEEAYCGIVFTAIKGEEPSISFL